VTWASNFWINFYKLQIKEPSETMKRGEMSQRGRVAASNTCAFFRLVVTHTYDYPLWCFSQLQRQGISTEGLVAWRERLK
jgi:hypothetical protein